MRDEISSWNHMKWMVFELKTSWCLWGRTKYDSTWCHGIEWRDWLIVHYHNINSIGIIDSNWHWIWCRGWHWGWRQSEGRAAAIQWERKCDGFIELWLQPIIVSTFRVKMKTQSKCWTFLKIEHIILLLNFYFVRFSMAFC